jgi:alanyl-tRNA synthetase
MKSAEVRHKFIEFFKEKGHTFVPSGSTIPIGDQTLLFTIAGMTQFKAALTGEEVRPYKRATNSQKCIRAKDLDDVGKDGRHCTMFEMLGSWSFGDYYKREAIEWAYELVKDHLKFDMSKLWSTVHTSDDEAFEIWKTMGVPEERIRRLGDKDNFWAMGPTGPCGPCSELYLDQGEAVGKCDVKGFPCLAGPGCDCDRYLEFWNLVFMQFDRKEDGTLVELPMKSVDTGAGLERISALLQGKTSNFETDTFLAIKASIAKRAGLSSYTNLDEKSSESFNVVADHIRTLTFTLADGATFSNEGRGYVLRRILRRAVRHAYKLAPRFPKTESFLAEIVPSLVAEMGDFYPEIRENQSRVMNLIRNEELRFVATLDKGLERFNTFVAEANQKKVKEISGEQVFLLHDSFGFPSDLTRVLCDEIGFAADLDGFSSYMKMQQEKSKADAKFYKFDQDDSPWVTLNTGDTNEEKAFAGYEIQSSNGWNNEHAVHSLALKKGQLRRVRQLKNRLFEVILANTPFYPEGGGQVADSGWLELQAVEPMNFEILDVRKTPAAIVHLISHVDLSSTERAPLSPEELKALFSHNAKAQIDFKARIETTRHHTATHLLHKALQDVLGDGVRQAGSQVNPTGLRFDFTHPQAVSAEELLQIEDIVNQEILRNTKVTTHEHVQLADAKKMGAMAIFDEKYDDTVRVLEVPGFSMELCGGTHVAATGNIGLFKILSETSVTTGVRRIEAVAGLGALKYVRNLRTTLRNAATELKASEQDIVGRIVTLRENAKETERVIQSLQSRLVNEKVSILCDQARTMADGIKFVATLSDATDVKELELLTDRLKERNMGVVVVGGTVEGKAVVLAAVNPAVSKSYKTLTAGNLVKRICELVDGKGGGRPDFARGGGNSPEKLAGAFEQVEHIARELSGGS